MIVRPDEHDRVILAAEPLFEPVADVEQRRRVGHNGADHVDGLDKLKVIRSEIPAVTHVDYSARVQTVHKETNARYHALIAAFEERMAAAQPWLQTAADSRR